ncbi:MAG: Hsp70 family protein [Lachnospiraceae bacterium]|nr:Hsp70 family protein [Lachnospiraceae bacterium]
MGIRVGIDLGTTFSAVAKLNKNTGKPEVIKNSMGSNITPSVLCFEENGKILFGEDAKGMQEMGNENTIAFFKRYMGNERFCPEFFGKSYTAADLSAILLKNLVKEAEQSCGEKIDSAVITVPAYFMNKEREATLEAGKKAGLNVLAIINEPTAAAFAYGLNEKSEEQTVLIYDLGGGTFDVTIARINQDEITVLGTDGNHQLGGKDWDDCIAGYIVRTFEEEHGIDLSEDGEMMSSLLVTAENTKKQLSSKDEVVVPIRYKDIRDNITITESLFEEVSDYLLQETKDLTNGLLESLSLTWNDITGAILVGGSTRMRMVHDFVKEMSGKEPLSGVNVDEAVALGAAIRANIDEKGNSVSAGLLGGLVGAGKKLEVIGAKAVTDVTAHALGMIAVSEDGEKYINSVIIPKNTQIPAEKKRSYKFRTRAKDNELEVYVLQGAYERPLDNTILDKYVISRIEKVNTNPSVIEVSYKYNSNGVVDVSAIQTETGKALQIKREKIPEDMSWTDGSPKDQAANAAPPEVEVILSVDLSGSMSGDPVEKAKAAMKDFISQMDEQYVKVGLLIFADRTKMRIAPTKEYRRVMREIDAISVGDVGYCNAAEPFTDTLATLRAGLFDKKEKVRFLVVLTDGVWENQGYAIKQAKRCHSEGIEVMALGFGGADYNFLREIASTDEFASLTNLSDLTGSFSKIAQTIGDSTSGSGLTMI